MAIFFDVERSLNNMYEYMYINVKDPIYQQVLELRYQEFFKKLNLNKDIVVDEDEDKAIHLVCVIQDELIGYCRLVVKENIGFLSQIVIEEKYRGKGIGTKLILMNEDKAREIGVSEMRLSAKVEVLEYYYKLGYSNVGEIYPSKKTGLPHRMVAKKIGG